MLGVKQTFLAPLAQCDEQKRVRIMILIYQLGYGGAQRLILDVVRHINRDRFEIIVAMMGGRRDLNDDFGKLGVEVVDFGAHSKFDFLALMRFYNFLRCRSIDILHAHLPYSGMISRVLGRFARIPAIVYTEQNVDASHHPLTRIGNHLTLQMSDVFTAITRGVEKSFFPDSEQLSEEGWNRGRRHFTIYSGVDIGKIDVAVKGLNVAKKRAELNLSPDNFNMVCAARLHPIKGHVYLIEAMREIKRIHSNVHLLLLGDGILESQLKRLTIDLGLEDTISFLGYRRDTYEIMGCADCFVLPSLYEGFGVVLAEAMALSIPVISTAIPAVREVVEDGCTGLLVSPRNSDVLATAIIRLIEQPDLRREFGRKGRKRVEALFSIESVTAQYELLYDLVVSEFVVPRRART